MSEEHQKRRLTTAEWERVVSLYEVEGPSIAHLAATFGVSETAISKGLKKRGAVKGCRSHLIGDAATNKIKENSDRSMDRIQQMKTNFESWNTALAQLTMRMIISQTKKAGHDSFPNFDTIKDSLSALLVASKILSSCRGEVYKINRLDELDSSIKEAPIVAVTEYSEEEYLQIHKEAERKRLQAQPDYVSDAAVPDDILKEEE